MRWRGWFRLWIVIGVIAVPAIALYGAHLDMEPWQRITDTDIRFCVDEAENNPAHPDSEACMRQHGDYRTVFEREGTTPAHYWTEAIAVSLAIYLALTGIVAVMIAAGVWVWRGFTGQTRI